MAFLVLNINPFASPFEPKFLLVVNFAYLALAQTQFQSLSQVMEFRYKTFKR